MTYRSVVSRVVAPPRRRRSAPPGARQTDSDDTQTDDPHNLRDVRGAVYLPQKDWNAYQMWANYDPHVVERDLGYATRIGLNSLRVFASYEHWREDGPAFFARIEQFLSTCDSHGVRPLVVLFEAPPKAPPTEENCRATDPEAAFGVHSPSWPRVIGPRNWKGYARSPVHFARRWAEEYAEDPRLLATEIMNEPAKVQPRRDFVLDALRTVRKSAPDATLTMGTKDLRFARFYDREGLLDAYQFHMNLPRNPRAARRYVGKQREIAEELSDLDPSKPVWCTEWQRTLEEPPTRFAPNLASLGPTLREARETRAVDGDFFWSLMLRPAYLRVPRERGRVNGLFHADGAVYSRADADAIAGVALDALERRALPASWGRHKFPYPGQYAEVPADSSADAPAAASETDAAGAGVEGVPEPNEVALAGESFLERIARLFGTEGSQKGR